MGIRKEDVDLINTEKKITKQLVKKHAYPYFKAPIIQRNGSENYYLPERGVFSLPIRFVNYFYNLANKLDISNNKSLEHFLTKIINVEELLKLLPQRNENKDNQSKRLHKAITHLVGSKKEAKQIINSQADKLNKLVMKSIRKGKNIGYFNRIKDLKGAVNE